MLKYLRKVSDIIAPRKNPDFFLNHNIREDHLGRKKLRGKHHVCW